MRCKIITCCLRLWGLDTCKETCHLYDNLAYFEPNFQFPSLPEEPLGILSSAAVNVRVDDTPRLLYQYPVVKVHSNQCDRHIGERFTEPANVPVLHSEYLIHYFGREAICIIVPQARKLSSTIMDTFKSEFTKNARKNKCRCFCSFLV